MFSLYEIIKALTGKELPDCRLTFSEAAVDSRVISEGMLFAAIPGEQTDGHRFVPSAFANGAKAALIQEDLSGEFCVLDLRDNDVKGEVTEIKDRPLCIRVDNTVEALQKIAAYHRRQLRHMEVLGITGSVGKTTTKELVSDVLSRRYRTLKTSGNMNNEIGLPLTLLRCSDETEQAVLEMGFYVPGEIDQLCGIALPSVGILTNVGMVHASRAGSMEVIAQGKSELVRALPADGTAILNYDDPYVRPMAELTDAKVFYYGLDPHADLSADRIVSFGADGVQFDLHYLGEKYPVRSHLVGQHSVLTALRGAAAGIVRGLSMPEIIDALENSESKLRMRFTRTAGGAVLIDDTYNASPEATIAALNLLGEMKGTKIAVLGEMRELGQYEQKGHEMVGRRAAEVCDELVAVGPVTKYISGAASAGGLKADRIHWFETVPEATAFLKETHGKEGEVMLIKGSLGMRMKQIVDALEEKK